MLDSFAVQKVGDGDRYRCKGNFLGVSPVQNVKECRRGIAPSECQLTDDFDAHVAVGEDCGWRLHEGPSSKHGVTIHS